MDWLFFATFAVWSGTCLWVATRPTSTAMRRSRGQRLAERYQLHVYESAVTEFDEGLDRMRHRQYLSLAVGFLIVGAIVARLDPDTTKLTDMGVYVLVLWSLSFLTLWLGTILGEVNVRLLRRSGTRAARLRSLTMSDFVHPSARVLFASLSALSVVVGLLAWRGSALHEEDAIMLSLAAPLLFLCCEAFGRLLVNVPQPATTSEELYVRDALRSDSLTNTYLVGLAASAPCLAVALSGFTYEHALWLSGAVLMVGSLGAATLAQLPRLSYLRFRSRLWPDLDAEHVVTLVETPA